MRKKIFIEFLMVLLFQGCAQYGGIPEGYKGAVVTVWDNVTEISPMNAHYFELILVDGRSVTTTSSLTREKSYATSFAMNVIPLSRDIPVHSEDLTIGGINYQVADIFGLGDSLYRVKGKVKVKFEPDKSYKVNGELNKQYSLVWVEEEKSGLIVSNILYSGKVPYGYIENLNSKKVLDNNKNKLDLVNQKNKNQELFNQAIAFTENNGCKGTNYQRATVDEIYNIAKILFENKRYQQAHSCFAMIAKSSEAPTETFKYLFLIYDVGLGVKENQAKAQYWKMKMNESQIQE